MADALTLLVLAGSVQWLLGSSILLLPAMTQDEVSYFAQVGRPLVDRGHRVYAVINGACKKAAQELDASNIGKLAYFTADKTCVMEEEPSEKMQNQKSEMIMKPQSAIILFVVLYMQSSMFTKEHEALFSDKRLLERISELDINLVIVDGMPLCLYNYILPYKLNLPYISLSTAYHSSFVGVPELPSFAPVMMSTASDQMNFPERVINTLHHFGNSFVVSMFPSSRNSLVQQYAPNNESISINALQRASKLWLLNTDIVLDYARVTLPHIIQIGGVTTGPPKSLPAHIASIADPAQKGLIIVSFGASSKSLPKVIINYLIEAFVQLEGKTIIWQYSKPHKPKVPDNIKLLPWIPQAGLLSHNNTQLFITHCDTNGQFDAIYHGVPMVGIPVFGEQPYNAARMKSKGFGLTMSLSELNTDELLEIIKEVLSNETYSNNIKHASKLYRSRPQTPCERMVYWIEHILIFGGDNLHSYGLQLEWYKYWCLDIMLFLFAIMMATFFIFVRVTRYFLRKWYPQITIKNKDS